jgi:hypothetical protein
VQTGDAQSLGAGKRVPRVGLGIRPVVAGAGVEEDGDEEEIEEAFALFGRGDAGGGPCAQ